MKNKKKIAVALTGLAIMSAMAMPAAAISACASENAVVESVENEQKSIELRLEIYRDEYFANSPFTLVGKKTGSDSYEMIGDFLHYDENAKFVGTFNIPESYDLSSLKIDRYSITEGTFKNYDELEIPAFEVKDGKATVKFGERYSKDDELYAQIIDAYSRGDYSSIDLKDLVHLYDIGKIGPNTLGQMYERIEMGIY
ncbi:MAG: hypothetical protein IKS03_00580 [Ruminococcus sp.]|nr:hypothetical protein [Ruminococcus sp.]